VFRGRGIGPWCYDAALEAWHDLCVRAGLEADQPHQLRHTATEFVRQGISPHAVQRAMGWAKLYVKDTHVLDLFAHVGLSFAPFQGDRLHASRVADGRTGDRSTQYLRGFPGSRQAWPPCGHARPFSASVVMLRLQGEHGDSPTWRIDTNRTEPS
jgi:hypothetical protein